MKGQLTAQLPVKRAERGLKGVLESCVIVDRERKQVHWRRGRDSLKRRRFVRGRDDDRLQCGWITLRQQVHPTRRRSAAPVFPRCGVGLRARFARCGSAAGAFFRPDGRCHRGELGAKGRVSRAKGAAMRGMDGESAGRSRGSAAARGVLPLIYPAPGVYGYPT